MKRQLPDPKQQVPRAAGWPGLLVAPLAALAALSAGHALVTPSCAWGTSTALHASFLIALALAAASTLLSLRALRRAAGPGVLDDAGGDDGATAARDRFVGWIGVAAGAFFTLVIAAQWFAAFVLPPCPH